MDCRTNGVSDQWCDGPMVCRTNGVSDQWSVGPMVCRTNGVSDQWCVGRASDLRSAIMGMALFCESLRIGRFRCTPLPLTTQILTIIFKIYIAIYFSRKWQNVPILI